MNKLQIRDTRGELNGIQNIMELTVVFENVTYFFHYFNHNYEEKREASMQENYLKENALLCQAYKQLTILNCELVSEVSCISQSLLDCLQ